MGFFQKLLIGTVKSLLSDTAAADNRNLYLEQQHPQPESQITPDSFALDHTIYCKWCQISDMNIRKKAIVDYLLTLNATAYKRFKANLEQMKENVIENLRQHEANEKFAWGNYIEDQIAYQNAKLRTGARDPKFLQVLNQYKISLETVCWTIEICNNIRDTNKLR